MPRRRSRFLRKPVEPFTVTADATADNVLERMERVSFQGRNLATARRIWEKMLGSDATIFMGTAGVNQAPVYDGLRCLGGQITRLAKIPGVPASGGARGLSGAGEGWGAVPAPAISRQGAKRP